MIEEEFVNSKLDDETFGNVQVVIVEPENSGSAIIDRLGYMIQEQEFPAETQTEKELIEYKRIQVSWLKHAFKCMIT